MKCHIIPFAALIAVGCIPLKSTEEAEEPPRLREPASEDLALRASCPPRDHYVSLEGSIGDVVLAGDESYVGRPLTDFGSERSYDFLTEGGNIYLQADGELDVSETRKAAVLFRAPSGELYCGNGEVQREANEVHARTTQLVALGACPNGVAVEGEVVGDVYAGAYTSTIEGHPLSLDEIGGYSMRISGGEYDWETETYDHGDRPHVRLSTDDVVLDVNNGAGFVALPATDDAPRTVYCVGDAWIDPDPELARFELRDLRRLGACHDIENVGGKLVLCAR